VEIRGYDIVYVDVTTADIRSVGLNVVRVIVPGLVPNAPAAFPFLGRRRVQDQAVSLGWRGEALEERQLNFAPIPHA
jgi:ribosomal protein S12 methylthiotransferase accessory factor